MQNSHFAGRWPVANAATAAVIADSDVVIRDNVVVVDVPDDGRIDVVHRPVIAEGPPVSIPVTTLVTTAGIAMAVVDAAIVADVRTPVTVVPVIAGFIVSPVRRRPERSHIGSHNPSARNPVISGGSIAPVARRPNVIFSGTLWLVVFG